VKAHIKNYVKYPKPKLCKVCRLPDRNYGTRLNGHGVRYYNLTCTTCKGRQDSARQKSWREKLRTEDPDRYYRFRRNQQLRRYYGITLEDYEKLLAKQGGGCAICGKMEDLHAMPVDHCHKTNKFRGVLCHWCNKGLGQFFDSPETLRKAAAYLDRTN